MSRPHAIMLPSTATILSSMLLFSLAFVSLGCTPPPSGRPAVGNTTTTLNPNEENTNIPTPEQQSGERLEAPELTSGDDAKAVDSGVTPSKTSDELSPVATPDEKRDTWVDKVETDVTPAKTSDELVPERGMEKENAPAAEANQFESKEENREEAAIAEKINQENNSPTAKQEEMPAKTETSEKDAEGAPEAEVDVEAAAQPQAGDVGQTSKQAKPTTDEVQVVSTKTASKTPEGKADPQDWLYWRGPEFNGISRATGLPDSWDPAGGEGSNVLWKREDLGTRSTPVVMNGKLFVLAAAEHGTPREGERVVCVDAKTGKTIWENRFNVYLSDVPVERVGWSAVTADPETNSVYALGVAGHFQCIDAETGKTKWLRKMHEEFGMLTTYGGRTNFPIVHEDLVIISGIVIGWGEMAKPAHRFLGMNKRTGEVVWYNETTPLPFDTTYSAPSIKIINGIPQYVIGAGDGKIWSLQPRTGEHIWSYSYAARGLYGTPLVDGDTVYMAQGEENVQAKEVDGKIQVTVDNTMGAVVALDATQTGDITISGQKWKVLELNGNRSAPLLVNGKLYVIDDRAKLFVLDPETGEELFPKKALGTKMFGSPLYADGKIYTITENGRYYVLGIQEDGSVEFLTKGRLKEGDAPGSPICAQGLLYFPTTAALYCVGNPDQKTGFSGIPDQPQEKPVAEDQKPVHVQLIPAEALIYPGAKVDYKVRLFNARGQFLKEAEAEFSVEGPASIADSGQLTANNDAGHTAAYVTAKVGEISDRARVRIVPELPWSFDFESIKIDESTGKGEPPVTWVGARYRHVVREIDGNKVMVKLSTIPKGTRSQGWMGHTDLHDYTIEADVMAEKETAQLPDIGLTAQGYQFVLMGNEGVGRVLTWVTQQRIAKSAPFTLEPGVWYHIKLKVSNKDGKAIAQGKAWKKDEPEPDGWLVETVDEVPNTTGSPGLFGNATNGEIYLDNIKVTPNS